MKRRTFIKLTAATTAAFYFPNLSCSSKESTFIKNLAQPDKLQHICDAQTIHEIGEAYQHQVKQESNQTTLVQLLRDNGNKSLDESAENAAVVAFLDERVRQDFKTNNTIVVDGWVLSVTEARQCALFSLTEK